MGVVRFGGLEGRVGIREESYFLWVKDFFFSI